MDFRERIAALVAVGGMVCLGRALLEVPAVERPTRTPLRWCYPDVPADAAWVTVPWAPPEAVRVMLIARDAVTGERLNARLGLRHPDTTFSQVVGGTLPVFWDVPPGFEAILSGSTTGHYSASGFRNVPDLPGAALATTVMLLPRPAPLAGEVERGTRLRLLRPDPAPPSWEFVTRLRASGMATNGFEEAWRQVFTTPIAMHPDGTWSHSSFPGLPVIVEATPAKGFGKGPVRAELIPIRDINRVTPDAVVAGPDGAAPVVRPPYPSHWPTAAVSIRAVDRDGRALQTVLEVFVGRGRRGPGQAVRVASARGRGSLEVDVPTKTDLSMKVTARDRQGRLCVPRIVPLRLQPWDRLWVPALQMERGR